MPRRTRRDQIALIASHVHWAAVFVDELANPTNQNAVRERRRVAELVGYNHLLDLHNMVGLMLSDLGGDNTESNREA